MKNFDLTQDINYIDIGTKSNLDIARWRLPGKKVFPVDIIAARKNAVENIFIHMENNEKKTVYMKKNDFIFTIGSQPNIQYQLLEAILEKVSYVFFDQFGSLPVEFLKNGATNGINEIIPEILNEAQGNEIKYVRAYCKICNKMKKICVKRQLVEKAENYPVSLVYFHEGHGLLIYLDANFSVRGAEIVDITG